MRITISWSLRFLFGLCLVVSMHGTSFADSSDPDYMPPHSVRAEPPRFADLMFKFLLAEMAIKNQLNDLAAEAYYELLLGLEDPRIAELAADTANKARREDLALKSAQIWYRLEPSSRKAQLIMLTMLVRMGSFEDARSIATRFLAAEDLSDNQKIDYFLELTLRTPFKKQALGFLEQSLFGIKDSGHKSFSLGKAASAAGLFAQAIDYFDNALATNGSWEEVAIEKAKALREIGVAGASNFLEKFIKEHPGASEARSIYAQDLIRNREYEKVIPYMVDLIQADPSNPSLKFTLGLVYLELGEFDEAEHRIHMALALGYEDKDAAYLNLGQISQSREDYVLAARWYETVSPGGLFPEAQSRLAHLKLKTDGLENAIGDLDEKINRMPQYYVEFVQIKAALFRESNELDRAFQQLEIGLKEKPDNPDFLYDSALLAEKLGDLPSMETRLRRLIEIQPNNPYVYNALGYTLADVTDRFEEAKELIKIALDLAPDNFMILDSMGWVEYRLHNYHESLDLLRRAYVQRRDPEIAAHLGEVLWVIGRKDEAKSILQDAVSSHPDNDVLKNTVNRLLYD
jgi:tetratricopeptide (TPR) repeat protein